MSDRYLSPFIPEAEGYSWRCPPGELEKWAQGTVPGSLDRFTIGQRVVDFL
jgi:hypothetical protein